MSTFKYKRKNRRPNILFAILVVFILPVCLMVMGCAPQNSDSAAATSANDNLPLSAPLLVDSTSKEELPKEPLDIKKRSVDVKFEVLQDFAKEVASGEKSQINGKLNLNLFTDQNEVVYLDQVEKISDDNLVFTGKIGGDLDSAVTIVMKDGVLAANFRKSDKAERYEIRSELNGTHSVALKQDDEADSACEEVPAPPEEVVDGGDAGSNPFPPDYLGGQAASSIDILAGYTPAAKAKVGGKSAIEALIQMGIADTNRAMNDSGVNMQVRLLGILPVAANESGSWSSDLNSLSKKTDGKWDELHAERARLGADQVSLIGAYNVNNGVAGIGYVNSGVSSAFTITKTSAFSMYTFSHELGHNIGLAHSNGYVNPSGRFRTIIAYGSYPRIRRYSNPNLKYNGFATGDSSHNEAAILNSKAGRMAAFVTPKVVTASATF